MKSTARKLTAAQKAFVVQRLACFDSPREVVEALREEHGVEIAPQTAEAYDPHKRAGATLSQKWRDLFEVTRKAFLEDAATHVPIANKTVRLREMQKAFFAIKGRGNWVGAMQVLEQVAKEVGGTFTNRREVTGKDGGPIQQEVFAIDHDNLTPEALRAILAWHGRFPEIEGQTKDSE